MANGIELTVVGNLTADPELRYTQSGHAVCSFTVAQSPRRYDADAGEWKDGDAVFLRCTVWRDYAENVAATLKKGARVIALGILTQSNYETKDGDKRTSYELQVDDVGPALRFAQADVRKIARGQSAEQTPALAGAEPF